MPHTLLAVCLESHSRLQFVGNNVGLRWHLAWPRGSRHTLCGRGKDMEGVAHEIEPHLLCRLCVSLVYEASIQLVHDTRSSLERTQDAEFDALLKSRLGEIQAL